MIDSEKIDIILASKSKNRKKILDEMGFKYKVIPSDFIENINPNLPPNQIVLELALGKGLEVWAKNAQSCIIAADTIVSFKNQRLGKPKNEFELRAWLEEFSGNTVQIWTGNVILFENQIYAEATVVEAVFPKLSFQEIKDYIKRHSSDGLNKAGGFGIKGIESDGLAEGVGEISTILGLSKSFILKYLTN